MTASARKRCYIAAPVGFDTGPLVRALSQRGVEASRIDALEPGDDLLETVTREIKKAHFICAVFPNNYPHVNVIFESGLAFGAGRPLLILADAEVQIPFELQGLTYTRARLDDHQWLGAILETCLPRLSRRKPRVRPSFPSVKTLNRGDADRIMALLRSPDSQVAGREQALSQAFSTAFNKLGVTSSVEPTGKTSQPDMAIWIDETGSILGNPVLVKFKVGLLDQKTVDLASLQLKQMLLERNLLFGIFIYWDERGRRFGVANPNFPLVACLSVNEVVESLRLGTFAKTLVGVRNRAVHGVSA